MKRHVAILVAGLSMILASANPSHSADILAPAGLGPGDTFRFMFITSIGTNAASTDIADYNTFASNAASGYTFSGNPITWNAMVSTSAVSARDNVGGFGSNVPIYLTTGSKIANDMTTDTGGLWSGTLGAAPKISIDGSEVISYVWSGSERDGTASVGFTMGSNSANGVMYGWSRYPDNVWLHTGNAEVYTVFNPIYVLSGPLTIPVPEPSTYILGTLAALTLATIARRRRRTASA